jgi:FkbM family methyltransferase
LGLDPNKKHIIHIGLFTPRKNQAEFFEYARALPEYEFHCVGNQAVNFQHYWEPLMQNKPSNLTWWGERNDVDNFYEAADLFLFTSKGNPHDKETMPLVIREALSWKLPIFIYNLEVYQNYFDNYQVQYLNENKEQNIKNIKNMIEGFEIISSSVTAEDFDVVFEGENKINFNYKKADQFDCKIVVKEKYSNAPMFWFDATFANYGSWWCIPNPNYSIKDSWVTELTLEFYSPEKRFLFSKEAFIKENGIKPDIKLDLANPFDCLFHNYDEMFVEKKYDFLFKNKLDIVLDIGANAGTFCKLFLENGISKVYAFEPNQDALINLNYLASKELNLKVIEKAVHTNEEDLKFYIDKGNTTIGSFDPNHVNINNNAEVEEIIVPTITLQNFIKQENLSKIDLIKIDIEGAEYNLIEHLTDSVFNITDRFLIEWHNNTDQRVQKLVDKLISKGYSLTKIFNQNSKEDLTDSYQDSTIGTFIAEKQYKLTLPQEPKPIIIVDAFFHDVSVLTQLKKYLSFIKKLDLPLMLVTNSEFDSSLIKEFDYILYDTNNRLFEPKSNISYELTNLYFGNSSYEFTVGINGDQKHGLSVLSNLYHSTNLAKSLGYTHFYRIECDCFIENLDPVKDIINQVKNSNKKGYGYLNGNYFSFQLFYMELEYFTKNFPQINNEQDYYNFIPNWTQKDWLSAEEFITEMIKNSEGGKSNLLIKPAEFLHTDFGNCLWNTIITPTESDKIKNNYVAAPFKFTNNNSKVVLITWNCSTEETRSANYKIIFPNGETITFNHTITGDNGHDIYILNLQQEDTQIEINYGGVLKTYSLNTKNVSYLDNTYTPYS